MEDEHRNFCAVLRAVEHILNHFISRVFGVNEFGEITVIEITQRTRVIFGYRAAAGKSG
jgi:hypothetical protein